MAEQTAVIVDPVEARKASRQRQIAERHARKRFACILDQDRLRFDNGDGRGERVYVRGEIIQLCTEDIRAFERAGIRLTTRRETKSLAELAEEGALESGDDKPVADGAPIDNDWRERALDALEAQDYVDAQSLLKEVEVRADGKKPELLDRLAGLLEQG